MKLNNYDSRNDLLIDWMFECVPEGASALDIGANDGSFCPEVIRIATRFPQLSGVDPDIAKLERNPLVSTRYFSTLEDAEIPAHTFDVLYSFYVLEHVANPKRFLAAASNALKPGGSFFFLTPNGHHYFSVLSALSDRLGVQRHILGMLRSSELIESYHYPAVYKLNTPKDIERIARQFGFNQFEYRYSERLDDVTCYFPGVTKLFPRLWEDVARMSKRDSMLVNFMGKMVKG